MIFAKKTCCAVFLLLITAATGLSAVEIFLAPLAVQDEMGNPIEGQEKPEADLLHSLSGAIQGDALVVKAAEMSLQDSPRSFLEAARATEAGGYPYLLYGYVKKGEFSYTAEVKLLEREGKEVVSVFFSSDDRGHYQRLMDDLAAKIVNYFYHDVGVKVPEKGSEPERGLLSFPVALGYWMPAGTDWGPVLVGLGAVQAGVRLIPVKSTRFYLALGANLEYDLGMNNVLYESFVLHTMKVRLPAEGVFDLGRGVSLGITLGPLLQVDILSQAAHYTAPFTGVTAVMGISTGFVVRCELSSLISVGLDNVIDAAIYQPALIEYSPRVFVELRPAARGDAR